ncbi:MAG TPA: DUF2938 domain-containing protein [Burkholderiaceae bacterium]|jgi:hypothetical protein|nr:DUF2938 domain-containing protein [Burkholderiaceae bacterium]
MSTLLHDTVRVALIGIGATAAMDLWLWLLQRLNVPTLDMALIGRWIGHALRGRWAHDTIARATPIRGERAWGWLVHYAVGIAFAAALVGLYGSAWTRQPSLLPALMVGIGSVLAPWLVMQPAMGAGIASSRTKTPAKNRLRSLANHAVFGAGLYLSALAITWASR